MTARSESGSPRTRWAWAAGTFFGAGLLHPGPGTWGSLAALGLWALTGHWLAAHAGALTLATLIGLSVVVATGIPAGTIVARESGREDPGHVVIDEVAGQWLALLAARFEWRHAVAALILFRVFDILKPPPARQLERLHGGTGIMLDDLAAGAYAALLLLALRRWW